MRPGWRELKRRFIEAGMFAPPIRNIVYLTPASTIGEEDLERLTGAVISVLEQWTRL
jgi:adenosylmethionine---8-amino-7-oxononanoate aminotransferase